jgi:HK97 family phage major capsid protein
MPTALEEIGGRLDKVRGDITTLFSKRKPETKEFDWSTEDTERYRTLEKEAADLQSRYTRQAELEDAERKNAELQAALKQPRRPVPLPGDGSALMNDLARMLGGGSPAQADHGSAAEVLAKLVTGHEEFKHFRPNRPVSIKIPDFDFGTVVADRQYKTVVSTSAGFTPFAQRTGVVVPFALRRPVVADLIPQDPTDQPAVLYMEETTHTNNAAPVAEGGTKPEAAYAWTQRSQTLEVIAETVPVTEQQLEDVPRLEQVLRDNLTIDLLLAEENQLLNGTGTSPQLQGILTKTGIQTQAAGTDPTPDVILKAMTNVAVTGRAMANGVVLHPTNYMNMRLLRTADGIYIFGAPSAAIDVTIWGLAPVVTDAMTAGTGLVGDFRYAHISRRRGIQIDVGFVNDDFKRNQRTVRGELRESLEIRRAAAFSALSGLV